MIEARKDPKLKNVPEKYIEDLTKKYLAQRPFVLKIKKIMKSIRTAPSDFI